MRAFFDASDQQRYIFAYLFPACFFPDGKHFQVVSILVSRLFPCLGFENQAFGKGCIVKETFAILRFLMIPAFFRFMTLRGLWYRFSKFDDISG